MIIKKQFKFGDAVAKITRALHIPHCKKCEQRRLILNEIRTLGVRETLKRLKAVGLYQSDDQNDSRLQELIKKMEDCCGESNLQNHE